MKARLGCVLSCLIIAYDALIPTCPSRYTDKADTVEIMVTQLECGRSFIVYVPGKVLSFGSRATNLLIVREHV